MNKTPDKFEYSVFTVQDVETTLYSLMLKAGIAFPIEGQPGKLRITDIEQAKSQNSMAITLNTAGKEGWELAAINNSQLYIFQRPLGEKEHQPWQYKVLTIADIDKLIFSRLVAQKAAEAIPNQPGKYKILDVEKAKSQVIMPEILNALGKEGWILAGVNKSDLYIFKKPGLGVTEFKGSAKPANPAASQKTEVQPSATTLNPATATQSVQQDTASTDTSSNANTDSENKAADTKDEADTKSDSKAADKTDAKSDATDATKAADAADAKPDAAKEADKADAKSGSKKATDTKSDSKGSKSKSDKTKSKKQEKDSNKK